MGCVTIIRMPFGYFAMAVVIAFYLCLLPVETAVLMVVFPIAAITMKRHEIRNSWIGTYPNAFRKMKESVSNVSGWIHDD